MQENAESRLENLKLLLGLDPEGTLQDENLNKKLQWLLDSAEARLKALLGGLDLPPEMEHIIIEVAVIRFNRIGSEGMTANNVEGESQHFSTSDFSGFMEEITAWLDAQNRNSRRGGFKFL